MCVCVRLPCFNNKLPIGRNPRALHIICGVLTHDLWLIRSSLYNLNLEDMRCSALFGICTINASNVSGFTYFLWGSNPRPMAHKTIAPNTELRGLVLLIRCSYNFAANRSNKFSFTYPTPGSNLRAILHNTIALTLKRRGLICLSKFLALAEQTRRTSFSK